MSELIALSKKELEEKLFKLEEFNKRYLNTIFYEETIKYNFWLIDVLKKLINGEIAENIIE